MTDQCSTCGEGPDENDFCSNPYHLPRCLAPHCHEESREIPLIGNTGIRYGKRTVLILDDNATYLGWTHMNCDFSGG